MLIRIVQIDYQRWQMISAMEILLHTAEKNGNEIALRDETHSVSYRELLVLAYQISDDISKR